MRKKSQAKKVSYIWKWCWYIAKEPWFPLYVWKIVQELEELNWEISFVCEMVNQGINESKDIVKMKISKKDIKFEK